MTAENSRPRKREEDIQNALVVDPAHLESSEILDSLGTFDTHEDDAVEPQGRRGAPKSDTPDEQKSLLGRVEVLFRIISLAAISASAVLAAIQFNQSRIDERKERSVELMNNWQQSEERQAYARLSAALQETLADKGTVTGQVAPRTLARIKFQIGEEMIEEWKLAESDDEDPLGDVEAIFNYYSEVEFCIRARLCEKSLLQSYFGDEATSFWQYFRAYADHKRASFYPNFGTALESLVQEFDG